MRTLLVTTRSHTDTIEGVWHDSGKVIEVDVCDVPTWHQRSVSLSALAALDSEFPFSRPSASNLLSLHSCMARASEENSRMWTVHPSEFDQRVRLPQAVTLIKRGCCFLSQILALPHSEDQMVPIRPIMIDVIIYSRLLFD